MTIDTTSLAGLTDIDDRVKQMALAMPDFRVGDALHSQMVAKVQAAVPGDEKTSLFSRSIAWRDLLFPKRAGVDGELNNRLVNATGLGDGWWSDLAISVVCQSIGSVTGDATNYVDHGQVDQAVGSGNGTLRTRLWTAYSYLLQTQFDDFKTPFNAIDRGLARTQYVSLLVRSVQIHELWNSAGLWKNPDWELYHHWVKLTALGASVDDINRLIGQLGDAGLSIPGSVQSGVWTQYSVFLQNRPNLDHTDLDDACRGVMRQSVWSPGFGESSGSNMPEAYSFDFIANGMPGNRYHKPSGGSCLSGDTPVLMADGSFRPVAELRAGDRIARPSGAGSVGFVGQPLRNGRPLFSFAGRDFRFTATHPFVTPVGGMVGAAGPALASVDPVGLDVAVPTLGRGGIAPLVAGVDLAGHHEPVRAGHIERHDDGSPDEILYDLVPEPDSDGSFDYFIGAEGHVVRTTAEIPLASRAPVAGRVLIEAVQATVPLMRRRQTSTDRNAFQEDLFLLHRVLAAGAVGEAIRRSSSVVMTGVLAAEMPSALTTVGLTPIVRSFAAANGGSDWVAGGVFETLVRTLGSEVEAALALAWRVPGMPYGDRLALSVSDLHFLGGDTVPLSQRVELLVSYTTRGRPRWSIKLHDGVERVKTPFARFFDQVVYIPFRPSDTADGSELGLSLFVGDEAEPRAGVIVAVPEFRSYRRLTAGLRDPADGRYARVHMDVRMLTQEQQDAEQQVRIAWTPSQQSVFAHRFSVALIEVVSEQINDLKAPRLPNS
jgi:hypothetical protein